MPAARVAIVDPYSSGSMLAESLDARGVPLLAIESSRAIPAAMRSHFDRRYFADIVTHEGDLQLTRDVVRRFEPTHVIAGFESGVEIAERLSHDLGLTANDPHWRAARRDKHLMTERAAACGLRTARQFYSSDVEELTAWTCRSLDWPVIVKPPCSVASDQVFRCDTTRLLRSAAATILAEVNVLGERNPGVLVQEFLSGVEYAVDTVSGLGVHKITALWRYDRPDDSRVFVPYNAMRLLPYEGMQQAALTGYATKLLDALGIRFGPAHCELMWVNDEPVLIEAGSRMSAGVNAILSGICGGISQLDQTLEVILDPTHFVQTSRVSPQLQRLAANVFLAPQTPGRLLQTRYLDQLESLASLYSLSVVQQPGTWVERIAGRVTLVSSQAEVIERDIALIHSLERDGIFEVESTQSMTRAPCGNQETVP
jgi:biotin carboxylase